MKMTKATAGELLSELLKAEPKLRKWRKHGIGIVMTKETFRALSESGHPSRDFILQGVLVERRGNLRF
jgi:hypothetical protein